MNDDILLKLAMVEPPPAMLVDASNFCIAAYAHRVLTALKRRMPVIGKKKLDKEFLDRMAAFFLSYINKAGNQKMTTSIDKVSHIVDLNFDGWQCPFGDAKKIEDALKRWGFTHITCELHFKGAERQAGLWIAATNTLQVFVPVPKLETVDDFWNAAKLFPMYEANLFDTVEHELIHMVQIVGYYVKKNKDLTGLPTKKVKDKKDTYLKEMTIEQATAPGTHSYLEDAEFYTDLMDAINSFSRIVSNIDKSLKQKFLRVFIGAERTDPAMFPDFIQRFVKTNKFFEALKQHNMGKWKLAVKRMLGYLNKHPRILY